MVSYEFTEKDFGPKHIPKPADTDSEWILVDSQNESGEATKSPSTSTRNRSSDSVQPTLSSVKKRERCGGVKDIEDSGTATNEDGRCLECRGCKSHSPSRNHSTFSAGEESTDRNALQYSVGVTGKECECAFLTVIDDPISHLHKLTDILRAINRSLAAEMGEEGDEQMLDWWDDDL